MVVVKNRNGDEKETLPRAEAVTGMTARLDGIHDWLLERATTFMLENTVTVDTYEEFKAAIEAGKWVRAFHCGDPESERQIKEDTKATARNVPWTTRSSSTRPRRACACTPAAPPRTANA